MGLIDSYGRSLKYLRVSVTDRCNLRCLYCMPHGTVTACSHDAILSYEEILRLAGIAVEMGITKIRLTGGEPLVRKGIMDFLPRLTSLKGLEDVSLTTNGVNLKENLPQIKESGIKRINVSLDTMRRDRFRQLTGSDQFQKVWEGIEEAARMGFHPIKINMVVLKGVNDDEVEDVARLSKSHPYHVRFIEYMPMGVCGSSSLPFQAVAGSVIKERLRDLGTLVPLSSRELDGPAERYKFEGAPGEIGLISPITHHFCRSCNRLRLTASGHLRPCLLSDAEVDLKAPLRRGATDEQLAALFLQATRMKSHEHGLTLSNMSPLSSQMRAIGG